MNNYTKSQKLYYAVTESLEHIALVIGMISMVISFISLLSGKYSATSVSIVIIVAVIMLLGVFVITIGYHYRKYDSQFKYVYKQIKMIKKAKESILVVMKSLNAEYDEKAPVDNRTDERKMYKRFDEELEKALKRKSGKTQMDIRIITGIDATGDEKIDRIKGAEQIKERGIQIKFSKEVDNGDIRFIVVDNNKVAFSQKKKQSEHLSKEFSYVEGHVLGGILTSYFDKLWDDAMTYEKFIGNCINEK